MDGEQGEEQREQALVRHDAERLEQEPVGQRTLPR
jgi:hypothetical protein